MKPIAELAAVFGLTGLVTLAGCGGENPQTNGAASAPQPPVVQTAPATSATPPAPAESLQVGAQAPEFELMGSDGGVHRLSDYAGQYVVLSFFPKAFTGG